VKPSFPEFQVFIRYRDLKPLTQAPDIVPIFVIQLVTRVEFHEPLRGNASHAVPADHPATSQMIAAVRHPADIAARRVERVEVNVDPSTGFAGQNEVVFPAIRATLLVKTPSVE
jgi:hypothetical protein